MAQPCTVEGCGAPSVGRGLCRKHYMRMQRKGSTDDIRKNARKPCSEDGCDRPAAAHGLCSMHLRRTQAPKRAEKWREGNPIPDLSCAWCGKPFVPERYKDGRNRFCSRDCKSKARAGTEAGKLSALKSHYKRKYGLSLEEVAEMRSHGCAICGTTEWNGRHKQGHIDHCHKTGRIRGVLCSECNTGLGKFKDDPELLDKAAVYLRR